MADNVYIVKFKPPALGVAQTVIASTVEIHYEHLVFCNSNGEPTALFLLEIIQSWNEVSNARSNDAILAFPTVAATLLPAAWCEVSLKTWFL
jgi:hypothetical protein